MYDLSEVFNGVFKCFQRSGELFSIIDQDGAVLLTKTNPDQVLNPYWQTPFANGVAANFFDSKEVLVASVAMKELIWLDKSSGKVIDISPINFSPVGFDNRKKLWGYYKVTPDSAFQIRSLDLDSKELGPVLTTGDKVIYLIGSRYIVLLNKAGVEKYYQVYDLITGALLWEHSHVFLSSFLARDPKNIYFKTVKDVFDKNAFILFDSTFGALGIDWVHGGIKWVKEKQNSLVQVDQNQAINIDASCYQEFSVESGDVKLSFPIASELSKIGMALVSNNWFALTSTHAIVVEQMGTGLFALNRKTGKVDWYYHFPEYPGRLINKPILYKDFLIVLGSSKKLFVFRRDK